MTHVMNTPEGDQERRELALRITDGDLNLAITREQSEPKVINKDTPRPT